MTLKLKCNVKSVLFFEEQINKLCLMAVQSEIDQSLGSVRISQRKRSYVYFLCFTDSTNSGENMYGMMKPSIPGSMPGVS